MKGIKLLWGASILMVVGFFVHLLIDYHKYTTTLNSAPFWVWVCADGLLWLVPAALAAIAGCVARKKLINKEKRK